FDRVDAERLLKAGFQIAYHTLRLGEGADTRFNPQERTATLEVIKNSSLKLAYLVEPVGVEHSAEEIADTFLTGMKYGAALTGAMARVPVQGTPLGGLPAVSERRLAQVVAVTRLAAGRNAPDICVHPPAPLALEWGANLVVVENGAVPRDTGNSRDEWRCFGLGQAKELFERAGYKTW
ncbi:MAG: radical SAM protein, partial [Firmicutes bacterium]|nr:radical SAM protein [Bacillota bacterium]